ncbi:MAG: xanthine dehydrogenase family protein molybdopterin-binding subunit, partial [bacterium]
DYDLPFLAQAPMEPMNCTAHVRDGGCELWAPTQVPTAAVQAVSEALCIPGEGVTLHVTLMGGGFGRRLQSDYAVEAALISRAAGAPVQLFWTREDDVGGGWYRPASLHRMAGALDARGRVVAWFHRIVTPSISGQPPTGLEEDTFSPFATAGFAALPYAVPNLRVEYRSVNVPVPVGWWRSVYASQYTFANECFIDELAAAASVDPLTFRRSALRGNARARRVLDLAAERSHWGEPLPGGRGRGIALAEFFDTWVAHVAEVSVSPGGDARVERVTVAVDCGFVVHPKNVEAQIVGGTIDGLWAALQGEITLEDGAAVQKNFDRYRLLRMGDVPPIDVHIVPSREPPTGAGEPGVPGAAPAVVNAVHAATGVRRRKLPLGAGTRTAPLATDGASISWVG